MDTQNAYYYFKEHNKKYEFVFRYVDKEINLDQVYRFTLRPDETIRNFTEKTSSTIQKSLEKRFNEPEKKNENNYSNIDNEKPSKSSENKSKNSKTDVLQVNATFFHNRHEVNGKMSCKTFNDLEGTIQYNIYRRTYNVLINKPRIIDIELPNSLFIGYPVYPTDVHAMLFDKTQSQFMWHKSKDKINWTLAGNTFDYTPKDTEKEYYLKFSCIPKNAKENGVLYEKVIDNPIKYFTDYCPFYRRHTYTKHKLQNNNFRIISYNILADHYCRSENAKAIYHYCPVDKLNIDYRKQLILKELLGYNADIICLQEVDYKIFKNYLRPELQKLKLKGFYTPKESKPEGLACFFNTKRFKLVHFASIVIGKEILNNNIFLKLSKKISKCTAALNSLIDQNTILQVIALRSVEQREILFVSNTHLYFHPEASHIRLLQAAAISTYLDHFSTSTRNTVKNHRNSVICCGDFNSLPESAVYRLYTEGYITEFDKDWSSNPEEIVENVSLKQKKIMNSAYGTSQYTNYTEDFKGCLDYIFYDKTNLQLIQTVPLLTEEEMSVNVALPNVGIPSDHVALIADFKWI